MYEELLTSMRACVDGDKCENCHLVGMVGGVCWAKLIDEVATAMENLLDELKKAKTEANNYRKALEALDGVRK